MNAPEAGITELPSSPGARLRREREARGLVEHQAAEALNLDPTVITVLESNDFAALGAPVFVKGHLRRYAGLLGLDEDEIIRGYERSKLQLDEPTLVPRARIEMAPVRGRPRWPWVVGGTAAFLIAAALLAYVSEHGLPGAADLSENATADDEPSATPANAPALPLPGSVPAPVKGPVPSAVVDAATSSGDTPTAGTASAATPPAGQVTLQLRFSADSWVEIFDGAGKAVLYDLGKAGTERTLTATPPLSVTLGNAPGVTVRVDGRALPAPPTQGTIARFSVGADGSLR